MLLSMLLPAIRNNSKAVVRRGYNHGSAQGSGASARGVICSEAQVHVAGCEDSSCAATATVAMRACDRHKHPTAHSTDTGIPTGKPTAPLLPPCCHAPHENRPRKFQALPGPPRSEAPLLRLLLPLVVVVPLGLRCLVLLARTAAWYWASKARVCSGEAELPRVRCSCCSASSGTLAIISVGMV
jgi:hypothetical protein